MIVGEIGSGKTLILHKLIQEIQFAQLDYNIVMIDLGDISNKNT